MENELIERIVTDAERIADETLRDAKAKADGRVEEAEALAVRLEIENDARIEQAREAALSRAKTVAELDANKLLLKAKVDCVDDCFEGALLELAKLPDKTYAAYIEKLLIQYAEDGDTVIVAERDAKRVTAALVEGAAKKKGIKLKLSKKYGAFAGGVVLAKGGVEKNLTLEMQLKECKPALTGEVLRLLGL